MVVLTSLSRVLSYYNMNKIINIFLLIFLSVNLQIFAGNDSSFVRVFNLAPKVQNNSIDFALSRLNLMKESMGEKAELFAVSPNKIVLRNIFLKAGDIYNNHGIGALSFKDRARFVMTFFSPEHFIVSDVNKMYLDEWVKTGEEIKLFINAINGNKSQYIDSNDRLTPYGRDLLQEWENIHLTGTDINGNSFNFEQNVDFNIAVEWFLFYLGKDLEGRYNELYALEQEVLLEELNKEYKKEGLGNLQKIYFLTDIHAGNDRLFPLVANAFGIKYDDYRKLETLDDLIVVLNKYGLLDENMNVKPQIKRKIRFKGFSDMLDRGYRYLEVHDCAVWLQKQNMLDHLSGNHEQGFSNGVTKIHLMERFKELVSIDPIKKILKYSGETGEHIVYWAFEMVTHSGWVTNTIDEVNEKRFNELMKWLNASFGFDFAMINIVEYREKGAAIWLKELKKRNNVIREGDKYFDDDDNSHRGRTAMAEMEKTLNGYENTKIKDFPRNTCEKFIKNMSEIIHVFHAFEVVLPFLKELSSEIDEDITLNEALLKLSKRHADFRSKIESALNWTAKYALGDGSLKGALSFYENVNKRMHLIIEYKINDTLVADALALIKEFNQIYPLTDILDETTAFINKSFDRNMTVIEAKITTAQAERLKSELAEKILSNFTAKRDNYEKSEAIMRDLINKLVTQNETPKEKIEEYSTGLQEEVNQIKKALDAEKLEIDTLLENAKSVSDIIRLLEFFYKNKRQLNLFNITEDLEIRNNISLWDMANYKLMDIDKYGNMYFHAMLPTKEIDGKLVPIVNFRGRTGIKAVSAMQVAVRKFFSPFKNAGVLPDFKVFTEIMFDNIGDALTEVNSWYSDITSSSKAKEINPIFSMENYGHIFDNLRDEGTGLNRGGKPNRNKMLLSILMGHNPYKKREGKGGVPYACGPVINGDDGMATGYTHTGVSIELSPYGFFRNGFLSSTTDEISDMTHLALRTDSRGGGISFEELAAQGDGPIHRAAKEQLKKINNRNEILKLRIIQTIESIIFEYNGLLEYAKKINNRLLIEHYANAIKRMNKYFVSEEIIQPQQSLVAYSA